jgi:hypothetical protein
MVVRSVVCELLVAACLKSSVGGEAVQESIIVVALH